MTPVDRIDEWAANCRANFGEDQARELLWAVGEPLMLASLDEQRFNIARARSYMLSRIPCWRIRDRARVRRAFRVLNEEILRRRALCVAIARRGL